MDPSVPWWVFDLVEGDVVKTEWQSTSTIAAGGSVDLQFLYKWNWVNLQVFWQARSFVCFVFSLNLANQ